jgi:hypothetical protein
VSRVCVCWGGGGGGLCIIARSYCHTLTVHSCQRQSESFDFVELKIEISEITQVCRDPHDSDEDRTNSVINLSSVLKFSYLFRKHEAATGIITDKVNKYFPFSCQVSGKINSRAARVEFRLNDA